ncbi:ABC transporter ATP-binding protein, partial [Clostridium perfringens]|nr:ABC transporter ATP-binding protein [Clostridium perfringens]
MISLKEVNKEYTQGVKAVDNLNLEIKDGEIFGILG